VFDIILPLREYSDMVNLEYRILDGKKLRAARGDRALPEIRLASGNYFSEQRLSYYETGKFFPKPFDVPRLLLAYGVEWADVSSPVELEIAA